MRLFEQAALGTLTLRNRIVMPAMATLFGDRDGKVSRGLVAYYARRAKGGVGLVIVENTAVHPQGVNYPGTLEIHGPEFEKGLAGLAAAIKDHGAAAALQLFHPGRQVHPKYAGNYPVAPSPIPCPVMGGNPRELTTGEIHDLVRRFGEGAARAKEVGFQAVEIHAAHGYLVGQFLSPASNRRADRYGGDPERRARFAVEIVEAIRDLVGPAFPILFRISADEKVPGGLTLEDTQELVPRLERAGVTAFHVSAGTYPSMEWVVQPYLQARGCLKELAAGVRNVTSLPIVAVGRINDPAVAASIVENGLAHFVSMGRALIADPDLPCKASQGRLPEIRPCLGCNVCIEAVGTRRTRCAVNPEMGRESEAPPAAAKPRRVLVVGGGPAGIQAALRARTLGHEVRLLEAAEHLGGQLRPAGVPGSKAEVRRLLDHLCQALERSGVTVELGKPLSEEITKAYRPDHVVLAAGAVPRDAGIGVAGGAAPPIQAVKVLSQGAPLRGRTAVIGGGPVGLDAAEFLADGGSGVVVLEMTKQIGNGIEWNVRKMKLRSLEQKGVAFLTRSRAVRIEENFLVYADSEGAERELQVENVVVAVGSLPCADFERELRAIGLEVTRVGDCAAPRGLAEAISEGFDAATRLGTAPADSE